MTTGIGGQKIRLLVFPILLRENNIVPLGYVSRAESLLLTHSRVNTARVGSERPFAGVDEDILLKTSPENIFAECPHLAWEEAACQPAVTSGPDCWVLCKDQWRKAQNEKNLFNYLSTLVSVFFCTKPEVLTCYAEHLLLGNTCSLCQDRSNEGERWPTAGLTSPKPSTLSAYVQSQLRLPVPSDQSRRSPASRALCCPSNACCHSNSPGASEMRRKPSRCDTAPTAESCPSGVAAGSQAGCPQALT